MNLITVMERDKLPMPHFWYLPRGEKAVVVMSGDDHSPSQATGGTAAHFDRYKALSPAGCSVVNWDCVRASVATSIPTRRSRMPRRPRTTRRASRSALHPLVSSCQTTPITEAELATFYDTQLTSFRAKYTGIPTQVSSRTHCVYWPDWASNAKVELARGIRMDANYYHYPGPWIGAKPGFMNGGGFPMRFADVDGTQIDVYQANTNMTDESTTNYSTTINALLDNAIGSLGLLRRLRSEHAQRRHGQPPRRRDDHRRRAGPQRAGDLVQAAARLGRRPEQLDDPRPQLEQRHLHLCHDRRRGRERPADDAPDPGPRPGTLTGITRAGSPVTYTVQTVKGIQYAVFTAATATFVATYS